VDARNAKSGGSYIAERPANDVFPLDEAMVALVDDLAVLVAELSFSGKLSEIERACLEEASDGTQDHDGTADEPPAPTHRR
jgi:hypothetical protein